MKRMCALYGVTAELLVANATRIAELFGAVEFDIDVRQHDSRHVPKAIGVRDARALGGAETVRALGEVQKPRRFDRAPARQIEEAPVIARLRHERRGVS